MLSVRIELTNREDGIVISTVDARPMMSMDWYGNYETAISIDGQLWRIAEGYNTEQQARTGHKKYKNMSKVDIKKLDWIG